jgi:hypothetical protein
VPQTALNKNFTNYSWVLLEFLIRKSKIQAANANKASNLLCCGLFV